MLEAVRLFPVVSVDEVTGEDITGTETENGDEETVHSERVEM